MTLEPLIDTLREAIAGVGWELSGLQKTTSHQFEGRWKGESTRSAYLFFHRSDGPDFASVDVYLDETSRGMTGNVALVVDLRPMGEVGKAEDVLSVLASLSARELRGGQRRPLSPVSHGRCRGVVEGPDTEGRLKVRGTGWW
ncbi:MAG: hypothetical protein OXU39_01805, partial [Gemmatimonadota bacterium]|nr:hypothetical protein [Gemmatimonadota bacterium]